MRKQQALLLRACLFPWKTARHWSLKSINWKREFGENSTSMFLSTSTVEAIHRPWPFSTSRRLVNHSANSTWSRHCLEQSNSVTSAIAVVFIGRTSATIPLTPSKLKSISSSIAGPGELFSSDVQACARSPRWATRCSFDLVKSAAAAVQQLDQRSASEFSP